MQYFLQLMSKYGRTEIYRYVSGKSPIETWEVHTYTFMGIPLFKKYIFVCKSAI